jgi:hypothetical protein
MIYWRLGRRGDFAQWGAYGLSRLGGKDLGLRFRLWFWR